MNLKINTSYDKEKVKDYIARLPDGKYDVSVRKRREIRTINQHRLYWLWLTCIMAETGNHKDDLHEYFKDTYLPREIKHVFDKDVMMPVSTTGLDTAQFTHYLERIKQFAGTELGILLPDPNDLHWTDFYDKYKDFI